MDDLFGDLPVQEPKDGKACVKCGIKQPEEHFRMACGANYRRTECRTCETKSDRLKRRLKEENEKPDENYECPICGTKHKDISYAGRGTGLVLDHCHETEEFRGWLCDYCNRGLGAFNDSLERLQNAIEYLRTNNGKEEG